MKNWFVPLMPEKFLSDRSRRVKAFNEEMKATRPVYKNKVTRPATASCSQSSSENAQDNGQSTDQ
jgi:hypothetical protein